MLLVYKKNHYKVSEAVLPFFDFSPICQQSNFLDLRLMERVLWNSGDM